MSKSFCAAYRLKLGHLRREEHRLRSITSVHATGHHQEAPNHQLRDQSEVRKFNMIIMRTLKKREKEKGKERKKKERKKERI